MLRITSQLVYKSRNINVKILFILNFILPFDLDFASEKLFIFYFDYFHKNISSVDFNT